MLFQLIRYGLRQETSTYEEVRQLDAETKHDLGVDEDGSLSSVFKSGILRGVLEIQRSGVDRAEFGREFFEWFDIEARKLADARGPAAVEESPPLGSPRMESPRGAYNTGGVMLLPKIRAAAASAPISIEASDDIEAKYLAFIAKAKQIEEDDAAFASHPSVIIFAILGIPTRNYRIYDIMQGKKPSYRKNFRQNLFRQLGLTAPQMQKALDAAPIPVILRLLPILAFAWHVLMAPVNLILTAARMAFEVLPFVFAGLFYRGFVNRKNAWDLLNSTLAVRTYNRGQKLIFRLLAGPAMVACAMGFGLARCIVPWQGYFISARNRKDLWNLGEFVKGGTEGNVKILT